MQSEIAQAQARIEQNLDSWDEHNRRERQQLRERLDRVREQLRELDRQLEEIALDLQAGETPRT